MSPHVAWPIVWLDEAKAEFYKAEQWYADVSVSLSPQFVQAVEDTVQLITAFPFRFPVIYRGRRRAGVKRFPHGLFYQVEAERIVLLARFHGKRTRTGGKTDRSRNSTHAHPLALTIPPFEKTCFHLPIITHQKRTMETIRNIIQANHRPIKTNAKKWRNSTGKTAP